MLHTICYPEAFRRIRKAANIARGYHEGVQKQTPKQQVNSISQDAPILGILVTADSISYATLMISIMYCGYALFPISTRNSVIAVVHLVRLTGIRHLFISPDPTMQRLVVQGREALRTENSEVQLVPMPQFDDLYNESLDHEGMQKGALDSEKTILILHSSGSTALSKPIHFETLNFLMLDGFLPFLLKDSHIAAATMFGRGRFQYGVLVHPKEPFDPSDKRKLIELRNKIWKCLVPPSFEKMNEFAPQHSRGFKRMIVVTCPSKPMEFTVKGTSRRQVCIKAYSEEIDAVYAAVENSSQTDLAAPSQWTRGSAANFLKSVVDKILPNSLRDDDDLFQMVATVYKLHSVCNSGSTSVTQIPQNFVYANRTVLDLSDFVWSLFSEKGSVDAEAQVAAKVEAMHAMVDRYGSNFGTRAQPSADTNDFNGHKAETVLVTGTTGCL
ncbi:hypothetical protein OBBRIDRAFT_836723 [Obba rivulosa]|uniref:AMP-dependent synthetase/ligase domain-containing protein n=1 Tax=Obba rivulosa TaxID=1052685 RepID=A0A8E2DJW5_9APHY|nr:hypothetical protein OBBRIDRAFT_836723 [Obba rivulosa]